MKTINPTKLTWQTRLSILILFLGTLLRVRNVVKESELITIPLLLIVTGAGSYFLSRFQWAWLNNCRSQLAGKLITNY